MNLGQLYRRYRFTEVVEISGVPVFVHWSLLAIGAAILLTAIGNPGYSLTLFVSYYFLILLHECGHMLAARARGSFVHRIELFPILGRVYFDQPYSRLDAAIIAWGGVLAQAAVAAPLLLYHQFFGFSRSTVFNTLVAVLGFYSLLLAIFNLLPVRPLDGSTAWYLFPELFRLLRKRRSGRSRPAPWRSWR